MGGHALRSFKHTKQRYGLDEKSFRALYAQQNGRCAISGVPLTMGRRDNRDGTSHAVVDHDHKNNFVRGLLCPRVNIALGIFQDSPELLRKAADYLEAHKKQIQRTQTKGTNHE